MKKITELGCEYYIDKDSGRYDSCVYIFKDMVDNISIISGNTTWASGFMEIACERAGLSETKNLLVKEGDKDIELTFEEYISRAEAILNNPNGTISDFTKRYKIVATTIISKEQVEMGSYYSEQYFSNEHYEEIPCDVEGMVKAIARDLPIEVLSKSAFPCKSDIETSYEIIER